VAARRSVGAARKTCLGGESHYKLGQHPNGELRTLAVVVFRSRLNLLLLLADRLLRLGRRPHRRDRWFDSFLLARRGAASPRPYLEIHGWHGRPVLAWIGPNIAERSVGTCLETCPPPIHSYRRVHKCPVGTLVPSGQRVFADQNGELRAGRRTTSFSSCIQRGQNTFNAVHDRNCWKLRPISGSYNTRLPGAPAIAEICSV
jgi:hypothetical protein